MTAYNVPGNTNFGDISPRTAIYAQKEFLRRALPYLILEKFGQGKPIPEKSNKVTKFRRYESLDPTANVLSEGVTPSSKKLVATDVTATLVQYGELITISDIIMDTHEDPVLNEAVAILGEQAALMIETMRWGVLTAGTSVQYANTNRAGTTDVITLAMQRKVTRALKRQNARTITTVIRSTPSYGTENVAAAYIGLCHPDIEADLRNITTFTPVEKYGNGVGNYEGEIGKLEDVRYIASTVFGPFSGDANKGAVTGAGTTRIVNDVTAANCAVYPVLYLAKDAFGIVPLKGLTAITPTVVNAKASDSDPLAQRTHVGYKTMQTCVILNDANMVRLEIAATL